VLKTDRLRMMNEGEGRCHRQCLGPLGALLARCKGLGLYNGFF
jgi:hypothetical protein